MQVRGGVRTNWTAYEIHRTWWEVPSMEQLVAMLNDALSDEWHAVLQYNIHASQLRGIFRDPVAEHMKEHADDEVGHADKLSVHLFGKGAEIQIVVPEPKLPLDPVEMIAADLEDEIQAIDKYTAILEYIGDEPMFTDTRVLIEAITTDEVSHQDENAALLRAKIGSRQEAVSQGAPEAEIPDDVMARALNAFVKLADQSDRLAVITGSRAFAKRADTFSNWAAGFVRRG